MKKFFSQYIPYYKDYKLKFFFVFIGIILVALGTAGTAQVIKPILDDIFIAKDLEKLYIIPFFVILLYSAKGFGRFIQAYYISYIGQDIIRRVRNKLLKHILCLDINFFHKKHSGELISRLTNDISRIQVTVANHLAQLIREGLTVVALICVAIYQSPELSFYGLVVFPLAIYPLSRLAKKMKNLSSKSQKTISIITSHLSEIFNNIEIIKANSTEEFEEKRFKNNNQSFFNINIKATKTNELVSPITEVLGSVAVALVIVMGGESVINGELTVGEFFSFMTALFMIYTPMRNLSTIYNKMQDAFVANDRVNDIFNYKATIKSGTLNFPKEIKEIELKNIDLKYDNLLALKNINLKVSRGEKIALIGDSGGGKSSLINLLLKFYNSSSGEILFNDTNIDKIDIKSLRKNISVVTQRIYIFNETIASNIAYGEGNINEEKIIKALKQVHAYEFVSKLKDGIHTKLDAFGTNLSGGQRQRIAIARALYKNPQILILDEATSALDNNSESVISELVNELSKNRIIFIIAHRLSTIKNVDKIAIMKEGEIIDIDKEENLLKNCQEFKRLHELGKI